MSENNKKNNLWDRSLPSRLFVCIFPQTTNLSEYIGKNLHQDRYICQEINNQGDFLYFIEENKEKIDCLLFFYQSSWVNILSQLSTNGILLPLIIIKSKALPSSQIYHSGEILVDQEQLNQLPSFIEHAIAQFLTLAPSCSLDKKPTKLQAKEPEINQNFLLLQQRRLAEKLKERLGYLGVYYKRNPRDFYRNLNNEQKQEFLQKLNQEYSQIILSYFEEDLETNQLIDRFVNLAFFADVSVSQILEIHMELMDELAQRLKIEGRSEEILLDYRLALIDLIAHLCEMYRRSIPREDLPLDALFRID